MENNELRPVNDERALWLMSRSGPRIRLTSGALAVPSNHLTFPRRHTGALARQQVGGTGDWSPTIGANRSGEPVQGAAPQLVHLILPAPVGGAQRVVGRMSVAELGKTSRGISSSCSMEFIWWAWPHSNPQNSARDRPSSEALDLAAMLRLNQRRSNLLLTTRARTHKADDHCWERERAL